MTARATACSVLDEFAEESKNQGKVNSLSTIEELATYLQVPKSWIYGQTRLKGADRIPCVRVGKYLRFDPAKVLDWLERRGRRGE